MKKYLEIGKVVGTHGIKGELRAEAWCDTPQFFCKFKRLYLYEGRKALEVSSRPHKNIVIVKIKGIDTIDAADTLRGKILYMDRADAELEKGAYFIQDLMGAEVFDNDSGRLYGKITDVFKTGANDVYQITDESNKDYLIPVIDEVVIKIDVEQGKIFIKPLKGIFEDED